MSITLYSTGCPQCNVLKSKLDAKGIQYDINSSVDDMLALGVMSAPVLKVDDQILKFAEAVKWVNERG